MNFFKLPGSSRDELSSIEFQPFSEQLKPLIEESLIEAQKTGRNREGPFLTPIFTVFVILGMAIRHDLSYPKVINWMISAIRWLQGYRSIKFCFSIVLMNSNLGGTIIQMINFNIFIIFTRDIKKYSSRQQILPNNTL